MSKFGIVVFPGSNCDQDCHHVVERVLGQTAQFLWHKDHDLQGSDVILIPGGFAYGDALRAGALARFSPIMDEVLAFANEGGPVLGICNGFQVLCEIGLLPGALLRNASLNFICRDVTCRVEQTDTAFTRGIEPGAELVMPVAHGEGNYYIDDEGLAQLEGQGQIVFRYLDNPNGARSDIAGICNERRNVVGLMPHPERLSEDLLGGHDGKAVFEALAA